MPFFPKSSIEGIDFPAIPGRDARLVLALQYQLDASQNLPSAELEAMQFQQFHSVLRHAVHSVPYYRQLFDKHKLTIPAEINRGFLQNIPILTRKKLQAAGDSIHAEPEYQNHGKIRTTETSGSTGVPVRVRVSELNDFFWRTYALRDHIWHQRNLKGKLAAIRWAPKGKAVAPSGANNPGWGPITDIAFTSGPSCLLNIDTPVAEQITWLQQHNPDYLLSFPSNLVALAAYCVEHKIRFSNLKEIRTIGETLKPDYRDLFNQAWGAKTKDIYTCEEVGYMALQCPEHDHYHVMSENIILEVVDDDNQPCRPGEVGRVLITSLQNFNTPLIRYELGDMAEFGEPCSCGRTLPVLKMIHGRKRNRLILPNGESRFAYLGEHGQMKAACGVQPREFQFIQTSLHDIEVKLVIDPLDSEQEASLVKLVQTNFGYPFNVSFSYHEQIERGPSGKFEEFICRVD